MIEIINPLLIFLSKNLKQPKQNLIKNITNRIHHFLLDIDLDELSKSKEVTDSLKIAHIILNFTRIGKPIRKFVTRWLRENDLDKKFSFIPENLDIYDNWENELKVALENYSESKMVWKVANEYPDYMASIYGECKNIKKNTFVKGTKNTEYIRAGLRLNGKCTLIYLHRIIALTFIPNPENHPIINHKDGNKKNNSVANLEWTTKQQNSQHSVDMGLTPKPKDHCCVSVRRICPKTREIKEYKSLTEAGKDNKIFRGDISKACKDLSKSCGGYKWEYIKKQEEIEDKMVEFKPIKIFPNYDIYTNGKVYSHKTKKFRKLRKNADGYLIVRLSGAKERLSKTDCITNKNNFSRTIKVHIIVAEYFIPNPKNLPQVNHKNKNRADNRVENLEWVSSKENNRHASGKPVIQLDKNRNEIDRFGSIEEASEKTGINARTISDSVRKGSLNRKKYYWEYANN